MMLDDMEVVCMLGGGGMNEWCYAKNVVGTRILIVEQI